MVKPKERQAIQIDDDEGNRFHAGWSRSGKRLIVSVAPRGEWHGAGQVELTIAQVETLVRFLSQTPD